MKMLLGIVLTLLTLTAQSDEEPPEYAIEYFLAQKSYLDKFPAISKEAINSETLDKNGDEQLDWYLEHPETCRDKGCYGMLFLKNEDGYCFAGYIAKRYNSKPEMGIKCHGA